MEIKDLNHKIAEFQSTINISKRMYNEEIESSLAHVTMLGQCGIISKSEAEKICNELEKIQKEFAYDSFTLNPKYSNIHSLIEAELVKRLGELGKKVNLAKSEADQTALNLRLSLAKESNIVIDKLKALINVICNKALMHTKSIMPSFIHMQSTEPTTFAHHIMSYSEMFLRDISRINDAKKRMAEMPLGSCNGATTTYHINRSVTTLLLGLDKMTNNSIDAISDRDFCVELSSALSIVAIHLSRFCEEIVFWSSDELNFVEISDEFTNASDVFPKRRNPQIVELVRGRSCKVFGNLISSLTSLKSLPLSYSNDLNASEEAVFDSIDTITSCLDVFTSVFDTLIINCQNMRMSAEKSFVNMYDCVDYLIKKGANIQDAYMIVAKIVNYCKENSIILTELPIEKYKEASAKFDNDILEIISLDNCIDERNKYGGPAEYNTLEQIKRVQESLQ